ncbi:MAG TPA: ROK family protein [Capsulimonadaceae bacterium]|jgi:glucokinase
MLHYLGVDIGGTKIAAAVVTENGDVVSRAQLATEAHLGGAHVLARALDAAAAAIETASVAVAGIGVGAGGQIDATRGVVISATDVLPGWTGTDIAGAFSTRFGVRVSVDNDVNALAVGEARFGAARGLKTVAFLALGTGVGGALLVDGNVYHGAHWTGGEFGHLLIDISETARMDTGGAKGTLEAYVSGHGLVTTYRELSGDHSPDLTSHDVVALATGDPDCPATLAIARTGETLGYGLVSIANMLDPDIIVIGGGLASLSDQLLGPARQILAAHALPGPATCPVVIASQGADASVIGAASLAMPRS